MDFTDHLGIADVAKQTGLTQDTLRWYERQGVIPPVPRQGDGRRSYDEASVRIIQLIVRLRRTGMPVEDMRQLCGMVTEGAASHGRRMALLRDHRTRIEEQIAQLQEDLQAVDAKIEHYADLIERGLDCDEQPVTDPDIREQQRRLL